MAMSFFWRQALKRSTLLDIETTGLDPSRHAPIGAATARFGAPTQETWFTYETAERIPTGPWYRKFGIKTEEQMVDLMEPFARREWEASWAGARRQWIAGGGVPQPARKYFSKILAREARAGRFLWTHNVRFDITQFGSQFAHPAAQRKMYEQAIVPGWTKFDPYSGRVHATTTRTAYKMRSILYEKPRLAPSAMREWYGSYRGMVKEAVKTGKPAVLDSLAIAQSMMGMAQQRGAMKATGDIFTGTSIEALAQAFGVTAKGRAHLATTDVETMQKILPRLIETTEALYKDKKLKGWQAGALKYLGEIQPEIAQRNVERMFAQAVTELQDVGKYRLRKGGYSQNLDDLVGVYKKFYKHRSYYFEGLLEETMTRMQGLPREQLDRILLERAKIPETLGFGSKISVLASEFGAKMRRFLAGRNPYLLAGIGALAAFGTGSMLLPDREEHNTVLGLKDEGLRGLHRRLATDFGSGYQGPNPWLNPEYNKAQEMPAYELMRASSLGLSEEMMYRMLTRKQRKNELLEATSMAGQAFHLLEEAKAKQGKARIEKFVYDEVHDITGHIDIMTEGIPKDVKTLSDRRFYQIASSGPDPKHMSQINFYAKMAGADSGLLEYVMRSDPTKRVTYQVPFSEELYEADIEKVERVRERIEKGLDSGKLEKEKLRYTASLDTLEEAAAEEPPDYESDVPFLAKTISEEMQYLSNTLLRRWRPEEAFEIQDGLQHGGLAMYLRRMVTDFGSEYQGVMALAKWTMRRGSATARKHMSKAEIKDLLIYLKTQIKGSKEALKGYHSLSGEMSDAQLAEGISALRKLRAARGSVGRQMEISAQTATIAQKKEVLRKVINQSARSGELETGAAIRSTTVEDINYLLEKEKLRVGLSFEGKEGISATQLTSRTDPAIPLYGGYEAEPAVIIARQEHIIGKGESVREVLLDPKTKVNELRFILALEEEEAKIVTFEQLKAIKSQTQIRNTRKAEMTTKIQKKHAPRIIGVKTNDSPGVPGMVQDMHNKRKQSHIMYHR